MINNIKKLKSRILIAFLVPLLFMVLYVLISPALPKDPGREFTLRPGQFVKIRGEDLTIKFDGVISDSRCPKDVVCVWAGEALMQLTTTLVGDVKTHSLLMPGLSDKAEYVFDGYIITFYLSPYPASQTPISKDKYRLTLMVKTQP